MATSTDIKKRALDLAGKTDINSIDPQEVGGLFYDLTGYSEEVQRNGGTLGIRKVYASVSAMEADSTSPVDMWGNPMRKGNLCVIYDGTQEGSDNNKVFAFKDPGWEIATHLDAGYATRSELVTLDDNVGISEYPVFSVEENYNAGDVVNYEGKLYEFTADHAKGAWIGTDAEDTSMKEALERKVFDLQKYFGNEYKTNFSLGNNSRLAVVIPVVSSDISIKVHLYKGEPTSYEIYGAENEELVGLKLIKTGCNFDDYIDLNILYSYKFIYIFDSTYNTNGVSGSISIINNNGIKFTVDKLGSPLYNYFSVPGSSDENSRLRVLLPINQSELSVNVNKINGDIDSYDIYVCEDINYSNPTLIKSKCAFNEYVDVFLQNSNFKYIYIFNSDSNENGIDGYVSIIYGLYNRVQLIENTLGYPQKTYFKKESATETNRLNQLLPISNYNFSVKVDLLINSGNIDKYEIYACETEDFHNLNLIVKNCEFGKYYGVQISNNYKYIYIFNSTNVTNISGVISIIESDCLTGKVYENELNIKNNLLLKGKTVVCLGDSITEFTNKGSGYVEYLNMLSGANVVRGGIGGTRYSQREVPKLVPDSVNSAYAALDVINIVKAWTTNQWDIVDAAVDYLKNNVSDDNTAIINNLKQNPIESADIVTLFAGTNDFTASSVIGEDDSTDINTVIGALNEIIRLILEKKPSLSVYVFTPTVRYISQKVPSNWSDVYVNSAGYKLPDLCESIEKCSISNHIPVCDLYSTLGWNTYNFDYYFGSDTTHPYNGFYVLAKRILSFINLCRNF